MSALVTTRQSAGLASADRRITRLGNGAVVAGAVLLSVLLFAVTPMQGDADFVVFTAFLVTAGLVAGSMLVEGRRRAVDRLATSLVAGAFVLALLPLLLVLYYTVAKGVPHLSATFFTHSLAGVSPDSAGGGVYHAIIGTVEQVGLATAISVPIGVLVAIYLNEYGRGSLARTTRFVVDVMTGVPSIVAGLFIFAFIVIGLHGGFSGGAGALSLAVLMLPVVIRASTDMLALVPGQLREASYALGIPRWRTIVSVVLPTASAGLTTGVMLAVARVTGETAPLLLTAFGSSYINVDPLHGAQSALPLIIFVGAQQAYPASVNRAWAAAFTLIAIVVLLYVTARLVTRRNSRVAR
ncbi:MAG TPA: phosphate ABC transporter permease PstA [Mycobacteriales bacterium]|nr:phosphate ABC transporter permease PstA [Mycobacteriales bacterium]